MQLSTFLDVSVSMKIDRIKKNYERVHVFLSGEILSFFKQDAS